MRPRRSVKCCQWSKRIAFVLVLTIICILLIGRVYLWYSSLAASVKTKSQHKPPDSGSSNDGSSPLPITICPINPVRGTDIFQLPNGSVIYEKIVDNWNSDSTVNNQRLVDVLGPDIVRNASHRITDILISCQAGPNPCTYQSFQTIWIDHQQCYKMSLNKQDTFLTLILNPEENQYLIPGSTFSGFRLTIDNLRNLYGADSLSSETIYLSTHLHSIISIIRSQNPDSHCAFTKYKTCLDAAERMCSQNCSTDTKSCSQLLDKCQFSYEIRSATQTAPSSFLSLPRQHKHHYSQSETCMSVIIPNLIQQYALLRKMNPNSQMMFIRLQQSIEKLINLTDNLLQLTKQMQSKITIDLTRLRFINDNLCRFNVILQSLLVKISSNYGNSNQKISIDHVYYIKSLVNPCKPFLHLREYILLLITSIIFSSPKDSVIQTTTELFPLHSQLRRLLKQLSIVAIKLRTHVTADTCSNTIVNKMSQLHSNRIREIMRMLRLVGQIWTEFQSDISTLKMSYNKSIRIIQQSSNNKDYNKKLVTVTVDIATSNQPNAARITKTHDSIATFKITADLLDIICSNAAIAALFLLFLRCLGRRWKSKSNKRKHIQRLDERSSLRQVRDSMQEDTHLSQVTFTL